MNVNTQQNDTGVVFGEFKSSRLVREEGTSIISNTILLPIKYAKVGKKLELLNEDKTWTEWMVLSTSEFVVKDPVDPKVLVKYHRRATGDSMPKRNSK